MNDKIRLFKNESLILLLIMFTNFLIADTTIKVTSEATQLFKVNAVDHNAINKISSLTNENIEELINKLGIVEPSNFTCNTACSILVKKGDEAVPFLQKALKSENIKIRYYSARCLGIINTSLARETLIEAFSNSFDDTREHIGYVLSWYPAPDAEDVYIACLSSSNRWFLQSAIKALEKIKSKKALPYLMKIQESPPGWHVYYSAVSASRKIEGKQPSKEIQDALDFFRKAKYDENADLSMLINSFKILQENIDIVLPDIFDIFLWSIKGNPRRTEPNDESLLRFAGTHIFPFVKIALYDSDANIKYKVNKLIKKFGWENEIEKILASSDK